MMKDNQQEIEVCEMQNAETVLGILRERGKRGLPCNELYRQLFNPDLYLLAYGRIYSNQGAMTPGVTDETVDGMSTGKIEAIIEAMRHERYRFDPARRLLIPKKNGKTRPLGLPTWSDKLVGEVVRLLLEAYYEPTFSDRSHGFRPGRGCHTALRDVSIAWKGTSWFIEGDIADCFGSLDHEVLIGLLSEKITDGRFLALVSGMLSAGYLEDWNWNATLSGAPQGGIASPVLSNIYLHKLDEFVEHTLIPEYTRGRLRKRNPAYRSVEAQIQRAQRRGDVPAIKELRRQQHALPSQDPHDPDYRRLRYIRYADDHLLGFAGPKVEAETIKERLGVFLRDELKLELSSEKTLITHARTGAARFLGYDIRIRHNQRHQRKGRRSLNGDIQLCVPDEVIRSAVAPYMAKGKPGRRADWLSLDDYTIVAIYGSKFRGIAQYYMLAGDIRKMHRLRWVMETSMLKTLAGKHGSSVSKMAARYKAKIKTTRGLRTCFEATLEREGMKPLVARFGGFPLARQKMAVITDRQVTGPTYPRKELITRLRHGTCEVCGSSDGVRVRHVKALADPDRPDTAPQWVQIMAARRRKTLIVCATCYDLTHR